MTVERERGRRGAGTIRELGAGRWQVTVSTTDPVSRERSRSSRVVPSYRAARAALAEMNRRVDVGQRARDSSMTFAEWAEVWVTVTLPASDRRPSTQQLYRKQVRNHLVPALGTVRLDRLRPAEIDRLILGLKRTGKAPATILSIYNVLSMMLDSAVRDDLLAVNPTAKMKRPTVAHAEAAHLTAPGVAAIVDAVRDTRLYPVVVLAVGGGLRRGELLALRWVDVDLDATYPVVRVTGTLDRIDGHLSRSPEPKTAKSRRSVPLTPPMVAVLRLRRREQAVDQMAAGSCWSNPDGLVFTTVIGTPLEPRNVAREYEAAARAAGVAGSLHTLRHTYITAMTTGGVDDRTAADNAGHSSALVTMLNYAHSDSTLGRAAAEIATAALGLTDAVSGIVGARIGAREAQEAV